MNDQPKPGVKTTEFWLALTVVLAGAIASVYSDREWAKVAGIIASTLAAAGYGFQRSLVKRTPAPKVQNNSFGGPNPPTNQP